MTRAERQERARELYAQTPRPSLRSIAEQLGVSVGTVHRDVNPEARKRYQSRELRSVRRRRGESKQTAT